MTDHYKRIPIRNELLEGIGRINWLAIRLHSKVRDRWGNINGTQSDELFEDYSLGGAIKQLRKIAMAQDENDVAQWCTDVALPAANERNGLVHAIAITNNDGDQALCGTAKNGRIEYNEEEINKLAGVIAEAITSMP